MKRLPDLLFIAALAFLGFTMAEEAAGGTPRALAGPAAAPGHADRPGHAAPGPRDWKQIIRGVVAAIGEDRLLANAAAVTFYGLLALFPALATLISLYGLIADPHAIGDQLASIRGVVPGGGMQIINDQVHSLLGAPHQALGLGAIFGILVALWSANSGMKALFDALNVAFEARERRGFVKLTLITIGFTLGAMVFLIAALGALVAVPAIIHFIGLGHAGDLLLSLLRWPALLALVGLVVTILYRYGPSRPDARWRWISWGSGFAALAFLATSLLFSFYVENFGSYNKTYGSLGAAVGFMTWIWISTTIVLIGAELDAALEKRAPAR